MFTPGAGRDARAESKERRGGLGVGRAAVAARVGGPVIRREQHGRVGGQQADDASMWPTIRRATSAYAADFTPRR